MRGELRERLNAFSDGVFAVLITVLVLDLRRSHKLGEIAHVCTDPKPPTRCIGLVRVFSSQVQIRNDIELLRSHIVSSRRWCES